MKKIPFLFVMNTWISTSDGGGLYIRDCEGNVSMVKVLVATKVRGFLEDLFHSSLPNISFHWNKNEVYEIDSKKKLILSKLVKSELASHLGLVQVVEVDDDGFDVVFSYNRFLKTKKDYIICLENPTALFHYALGRNKTFLGKKKINGCLNDGHLKGIVCISDACYRTLPNFYDLPETITATKIYPLVPLNPLASIDSIKKRSQFEKMNCLYISSNFTLKGGRDILACFKKLKEENISNVTLQIVTKMDAMDPALLDEINTMDNVVIADFKLSKDELNAVYNAASIFLNPTRQDSFSLVVLEAMKSGNAILSTDLYALNEMVEDGANGYLTAPRYRFFNYDNMPNESVWNNREETIYSDYLDENIVAFLYEKITALNNDRELLERMALRSFEKSNTGEFSEAFVKDKWTRMIQDINLGNGSGHN